VRHPLVMRIIRAYEKADAAKEKDGKKPNASEKNKNRVNGAEGE